MCRQELFFNEEGRTEMEFQRLFAKHLGQRNLTVQCFGCKSGVPYAEYGAHLENCPGANGACPFGQLGCRKGYTFGKLRDHYHDCESLIACKCPWCGELVPGRNMEDHVKNAQEAGGGHGTCAQADGVGSFSAGWQSVRLPARRSTRRHDGSNLFYVLDGIKFVVRVWKDVTESIAADAACYLGFPSNPEAYRVRLGLRYYEGEGGEVVPVELSKIFPLAWLRKTAVGSKYPVVSGSSPSLDNTGHCNVEVSLSLERVEPQPPAC
jgi:hypothetical protein